MDFAMLCPEVNSGLMYTGPGAGPMLAAAAGWDAVAAQLEYTAGGYSSTALELTGQAWSGPTSMLMVAAVTPYVAWLQTSATQAAQTAAQAYGAAAAYEAAFAMTVPPPVITANRVQLMTLVATNFFGQNSPAIAATEAQYSEMWAQDATAMYAYAADSSTASTLTPFNQPPQTTNEAGQAAQAQAVAQSAGNTAAARTQSLVQLSSTVGQGSSSTLQPGGTATAGQSGATITVTQGSVTVSTGGIVSVGDTDTITGGPAGAMISAAHVNPIFLAAGQTLNPALAGYNMFTVTQGSVIVTSTGNTGSISLSSGATVTAGASGASINVVLGSVSVSAAPAAGTASLTGAVTAITGTVTTTSTTTVITTTAAPAVSIPTSTATPITVSTLTSTPYVFSFTPADNAVILQVLQSFGLPDSFLGNAQQAIAEAASVGAAVAAGSITAATIWPIIAEIATAAVAVF